MGKKILLLAFVFSLIFNCNIAKADEITYEELLSNMENAVDSINDYSCKFTTTRGGSHPLAGMGEILGQSMPKTTEFSIWIKKPYRMKTIRSTGITSVVKKEGDDLYSYSSVLNMNEVHKQKLPANAWPAWPSLKSMLVVIKAAKDASASYDIERKEGSIGGIYILSFESTNGKRKDVYYINEANWLLYKSIVYENNVMGVTSEWQDVEINAGFSDDVFSL